MSLLHLKSRSLVPPDGFRYVHEDGHISRSMAFDGWVAAIGKYEQDNGRELTPDWIELAEDQLCRSLPPGWARYGDGSTPTWFVNRRLGVDEFISGTQILGSFIAKGDVVAGDEAERRAKICAGCWANFEIQGCGICHALSNVVAEAVGARATKADHLLKSCGICLCSNRAQVWVGAESLAKGTSEETLAKFRTVPHCWKAAAIDALHYTEET